MFLSRTTDFRTAVALDNLTRQADICRALGSPFVGDVLDAAYRQIMNAPITATFMVDWPGDPAAAALAMRLNGALHALARRGNVPMLSALYRREHQDFDGAIGEAFSREDAYIAQWMEHPTQTNEVARTGALMAALMVASRETLCQFELLELGSSCGLHLNLAYYGYDLGGMKVGRANSPVSITPEWRGAPPPQIAPVQIVSARGIDLRPLDPTDAATCERLRAFIWADQPERAARLDNALALAQDMRPWIDTGDAVPWLHKQLAREQDVGVCRVVMHSMLIQYLSPADQDKVLTDIREAGARATKEKPFGWISFEWTHDRREVQLRLTCWPTGKMQHLATCHPYGDWIDWRA